MSIEPEPGPLHSCAGRRCGRELRMPRAGRNEPGRRRTGITFNSQCGLWMLSRLFIEHLGMLRTMTAMRGRSLRNSWARPLVLADVYLITRRR